MLTPFQMAANLSFVDKRPQPDKNQAIFSAENLKGEEVMADLQWLHDQCFKRCLIDGSKWALDIMDQVPQSWQVAHVKDSSKKRQPSKVEELAWTLIVTKEFHRAVFKLKAIKDTNEVVKFLYYYARFLACENNRAEIEADSINRENREKQSYVDEDMHCIRNELLELQNKLGDRMDIYLLYVLGCVQKAMQAMEDAQRTFIKLLARERRFWPAWDALAAIFKDLNALGSPELGGSYWMTNWFRADTFYRYNVHSVAANFYETLMKKGFGQIHVLLARVAACKAAEQEHHTAIELFEKIRSEDPYRIDMMDVYSDSLYVRGEKVKLCQLSQALYKTHKYTFEMCCILGNYYSLRREHDKSIGFLQRAIRLNPFSVSPWILVGHEFMEVKNSSAACMAYRKATAIDGRDYRGWYGLGQLYDIMKMPSYSLTYYKKAHRCKPNDSRMLIALGSCYESTGQLSKAKSCYLKAYQIGDLEGTALIYLAKACERVREKANAATAYELYMVEYHNVNDVESMSSCLKFLANYYLEKKEYVTAKKYAERCTEFEPVQDEGRKLLSKIDVLINGGEEPGARPGPSGIQEENMHDLDMAEEQEDFLNDLDATQDDTEEMDESENPPHEEMQLQDDEDDDTDDAPVEQEQNDPTD
ncbi:hypothetical protein L596_018163 [Steinernema carpocapsae]|uniref:Cdc23 domain-containing protein n=1 Tax=Steinernema carpocapsae TaxID=34508 RepID=A0A4U5N486_STECR|nr:hypothetical protein L596_018163 [Steinernema carpocapsae]